MSPFFSSATVDITLITYSYSPKSFETPDQAPIYTSFTFNTGRSVRHALAYWISVGAGHYGDIDLLFGDGGSQPHWSGLSKQEVLVMEIDLRQRKVETVVQIVESLEEVWRIGMYCAAQGSHCVVAKINWQRFPPPNENLWRVSAAYEVWNSLSREIWNLHLMVPLPRDHEHEPTLTRALEVRPKHLLAVSYIFWPSTFSCREDSVSEGSRFRWLFRYHPRGSFSTDSCWG